jgi:excisionase family DNA binding protein
MTGDAYLGVTVDQVAEFLCVEADDVRELLARGTLAGAKAVGHDWRIPWESVEGLLSAQFDERRHRPLLRRWSDPRTWNRVPAHKRDEIADWLDAHEFGDETIGAMFEQVLLEAKAERR